MSKSVLYVGCRSGARTQKREVERAIECFVSAGQYHGMAHLVAEIANHCLDRKMNFTIYHKADADTSAILRVLD